LPDEARRGIRAADGERREEVEEDEEMDEESESEYTFDKMNLSQLIVSKAAAKHAEFLKARGRHYSNEAEAMKVSLSIRNQFWSYYFHSLACRSAYGRRR